MFLPIFPVTRQVIRKYNLTRVFEKMQMNKAIKKEKKKFRAEEYVWESRQLEIDEG